MRVLHLNADASGGSYQYAALLSAALAKQGIESQVVCKNMPLRKHGRVLLDRAIRRSYVSLCTEPWHGTRRLLCPPEDVKQVDVVHLHTVADWFDVPAWLGTLPRRTAVVISLHDMWHISGGCFLYEGCDRYIHNCAPCPILRWPFNSFMAKDEQRRKLNAYRERRVQFVANSQWLGDLAKESAIVKASGGVRVIPPGIDTTVFKPQDKGLCRRQLNLPSDAFIIVTGGASLNDANKNISWLFEKLSRLPASDGVIVVAFGEGAVTTPAGLNVRFTGRIRDRCDLARLFAAADLFVSSSLMETYGLTLVEAMACGTPVVAFRVGGIPEAAPDNQVGLLCTPHDGPELLAAVEKLRSSTQLRENFRSAARQLVLNRNRKNEFAAAFAQIYRDCLKGITTDVSDQLVAQI